MDEANILLGVKCCIGLDDWGCVDCPYDYDRDENGERRDGNECERLLYSDLESLYSDMRNVVKLLMAEDDKT